MPTLDHDLVAVGFYNTLSAGSYGGSPPTNLENVDDAGEGIYLETATDVISVTLDDLPSQAARVDAFQSRVRADNPDTVAHPINVFARWNSTDGAEAQAISMLAGAAFATGAYTDLARPGGGTWLTTEINAAEAGIAAVDTITTDAVRVTALQVRTTYQLTFGGFVWLLHGLVGAAVGIEHLGKIASYLKSMRRTTIHPHEYWRVLRDLRSSRPSYCFPGRS